MDDESADHFGDDVSVIVWKKWTKKGGTEKMNRKIELMENIKDFQNTDTRLVAKAAGKRTTASLALTPAMELVLAQTARWRGQKLVWKNEKVMEKVWQHTLIMKDNGKTCKGPGRSVGLQLTDLGMKWPRYDVSVSPDIRYMNLVEVCPDGVKNFLISGRKRKILGNLDRDMNIQRGKKDPTKVVLTKRASEEWTQTPKHCLGTGSERKKTADK